MASAQRIKDLQGFVEYWQEALVRKIQDRDELLTYKNKGLKMIDENNDDCLDAWILSEDRAVSECQKNLIRMESLLIRARNGEDF